MIDLPDFTPLFILKVLLSVLGFLVIAVIWDKWNEDFKRKKRIHDWKNVTKEAKEMKTEVERTAEAFEKIQLKPPPISGQSAWNTPLDQDWRLKYMNLEAFVSQLRSDNADLIRTINRLKEKNESNEHQVRASIASSILAGLLSRSRGAKIGPVNAEQRITSYRKGLTKLAVMYADTLIQELEK